MQIEMSVSESVRLKMESRPLAFWTGKFLFWQLSNRILDGGRKFCGKWTSNSGSPFPLGEISGRRPNANLILENETNDWRRWQPQSIKIFLKLNFPRIWAFQKYKRFPECKNSSECHLVSFSPKFSTLPHPLFCSSSSFLFLLLLRLYPNP